MADLTKAYPQKLGRFNSGSCMSIYYSEPIAQGTYDTIQRSSIASRTDWIYLDLYVKDVVGWIDDGFIFSSGIISGEVVSKVGDTITVAISKDSFVTDSEHDSFILKHSGISYNFEVLRNLNWYGVALNSVISNVMVNTKKRINEYSYYSPYGFNYNKDFYYEIETKTVVLRDESQIDDILRASSFVIKAEDESVINPSVSLSNDPDVIGITSATVNTQNKIAQPYFGGLQDNVYYRAKLINTEFTWDNGRYKGKLKFKITG